MEHFTLGEIADAARGQLVPGTCPPEFEPVGVSIDTLKIQPGELFFALKGTRTDGHNFIAQAVSKGAAVAIVSGRWFAALPERDRPAGTLILVDDPERAMSDIARAYRRKFRIPVVGITGSTGKTTTKEMAAAVLATRYRVLKTEGNKNNQQGVPLMLFRLSAQHEVAVLEFGISEFGELTHLCQVADPNVGLITNVGPSHLEFLGSVEGVAKAKGEILEYLDESSTAILNLDDLWLVKGQNKIKGRLLGFGIEKICQFRGEGLVFDQAGCGHFSLQGRNITLRVPGRHNVYNALAAVAVGDTLGVPLSDAIPALEAFQPAAMRGAVEIRDGVRILNDAYNANPASMKAALETLRGMAVEQGGRRIACLGDMLELGDDAPALHREVGAFAARGVDLLFATGPLAAEIVKGAAGLGDRAQHFPDRAHLIQALNETLRPGDVLLVKGSRGMRMEEILSGLNF
ncbi:MAG: UDP-N-acetylmuramoyl-tripeptide--D-alanyl-D-alanine ligase [Candidatus Latescibacteria bacterium]|nr:UDP-N-acetylmuramoyl-tripeptide--D-alanyl-D-alanine ligase [Candidatus Latescibacterota bacterium]